MKILLTGRDGQVGSELRRTLAPLGEVLARGRAELDLADADALRRALREAKPDLIVNAAAYTAVDKAESDRALALAVNGVAPGILAEEARRLGALLVHYSTDYVFDGRASVPYTEHDAPAPVNAYGHTKLQGELGIAAAGGRYLILRTSWVYALHGRNFLLTVLNRARKGERLRVVGDQAGVPNWSAMIARVTAQCVQRGIAGLYHLSASGRTSWYGFAREALKIAGVSAPIDEITTGEYPTAAKRPLYSVLDNTTLARALGAPFADWREDLGAALTAA